MKLLADATLGRLAKWLRILGYDTAYLADTDDFAVMRLARAEDRLVLTRDHALAGRRGIRTVLIESERLEDQLRQVWDVIGTPPGPAHARCPVCNQPLVEAPPELVADRVPPYIHRTHARFSLCVTCDRLYWPGSHWQRIQNLVTGLRDEAGSDTMELEN
jgi:uncharacterized protein with PIN domain